ncbi:MAG TPA: HlyD family efflux transporter periplasmic adaptor subunit [Armatimonadota bacterium]|nr:HlyD family efflux transporter periplasmic adaptor subunit [Armatimonadota bacterium]
MPGWRPFPSPRLTTGLKRTVYALLWLGALALVIAAGISYAVERYQREQREQVPFVATTPVRQGDFVIYADDVGALEAEESVAVKAETQGQVIAVAPNGALVRKDDVIVSLDAPRMQLAADEAERSVVRATDNIATTQHDRDGDVRRAELALEKARTDQEQARVKADAQQRDRQAQFEFDQQVLAEEEKRQENKRRQAEKGLLTKDDVRRAELALAERRFALDKERAQLDLEQAKAQSEALTKESEVRMAQSALERAKSRRDDDVKQAQVELKTQQEQLQRAREDVAKALIRAPKAGMVALAQQSSWGGDEHLLQEGDQVRTNRTVAQIIAPDQMQVVLQLSQRVGPLMRRGQRSIVWVHGLPGQQFPGKVTAVAAFASQGDISAGPGRGERTFRTCIHITKFQPGLLKPGMRATARIVIAELKDVVSAPLACVFTRGVGKRQRHVVWVREGKRFRQATVKLGQANQEAVIIESGVRAGARIALRDLEADLPRLRQAAARGEAAR